MGACFTVNLELTFFDEAAAVKAMQEYIDTETQISDQINIKKEVLEQINQKI